MMDYITSLPLSYSQSGPAGIGGVGNYELEVASPSGGTNFRMYFLDTGYDGVISDQQQSYLRSRAIMHRRTVPAVLFHHIPIPEFNLVSSIEPTYGHKGEPVSSGPQCGLLDTLIASGSICPSRTLFSCIVCCSA